MAIIVISFDGVEDKVFEGLANDHEKYPNITEFKRRAAYRGGIKTVFVSNTYPVHATAATGKLPAEHGIISNYTGYNESGKYARWAQSSKLIKSETIWDAAAKKGLKTAAFFWPTTLGSGIKWNFPEIHFPKDKKKAAAGRSNRLEKAGILFLDKFTASAARSLLRRKRPDLTLIHLIAYDTILHAYGSKAREMETAKKSLDRCLGKILSAAGSRAVLVFSDHAHIDVSETADLYSLFPENVYEQCGGCAFLSSPVKTIENYPWFGRFLTDREMEESGYAGKAAAGIAAKPGYGLGAYKKSSDHGYPADYENYKVFYAGLNFPPGVFDAGDEAFGDVRDVTGVIARCLGLEM